MSKININLLDEVGGSIVLDENAFPSVDAYTGDEVKRAIRLFPTIPGSEVKNVKMNFQVVIDGNNFTFKPENSLNERVKCSQFPGFSFSVSDSSNFLKKCDENGMYNFGTFSEEKDFVITLYVSPQTVTDHSQEVLWDNLVIGVFHA